MDDHATLDVAGDSAVAGQLMADILLDTQAAPATPAAGQSVLYINNTSKELVQLDDAGLNKTVRTLTNANTADVTANAADTYLTGSGLTVPPALLRVGSQMYWTFTCTKTAAGVATCIFTPRFGTAGTTADTALTTFTLGAQTAATDTGMGTMSLVVRTAGASGIVQVSFLFNHGLAAGGTAAVGMNAQFTQGFTFTSGAINLTTAALIFGLSCNPGTAGVWTFTQVMVNGDSL
jgi:hypothetical protein